MFSATKKTVEDAQYRRILAEKRLDFLWSAWSNAYHGKIIDPYITDGAMMNKIRAKIIEFRSELEKTMSREERPMVYFLDPPSLADPEYMANKDGILNAARKYIAALKDSPDYRDLCNTVGALPISMRASGRAFGDTMLPILERALAHLDIACLRRYCNDDAEPSEKVAKLVLKGRRELRLMKEARKNG